MSIEPTNESLQQGREQALAEAKRQTGGGGGMGGMGGMGGGMGGGAMSGLFQQMLMSNPGLLQDPEVVQMMQDPTMMQKIKM